MSPHPPSIKKRRKPQRTSSGGTLRVHELKAEARRSRKEKGEREDGRRTMKKVVSGGIHGCNHLGTYKCGVYSEVVILINGWVDKKLPLSTTVHVYKQMDINNSCTFLLFVLKISSIS